MQELYKKDYRSPLSIRETEKAIKEIKDTFEDNLARTLCLERISAPLFVRRSSGLNDNLNGVERPVGFDIRNLPNEDIEIVQSLAKWKRLALSRYGFSAGEGIYTDMNAIRRDDEMDNIHSVYVDQWDWEKVISRETRNEKTLKSTVQDIVKVIADTLDKIKGDYPYVTATVNRDVCFITAQELLDMYPTLSPKEREHAIAKKCGTVFLMQIGGRLSNGEKHDGRAPDYDDWTLNGDIIVYNALLDIPFELSSMGIRVDAETLKKQLKEAHAEERASLPFHKAVLENKLPLTMGGGIGQSRLCMFMLDKMHIGEVQSSLWADEMIEKCAECGAELL